MKYFHILLLSLLLLNACSPKLEVPMRGEEVYEEFWTYVDEHYMYFEEKGANWEEVKARYLADPQTLSTEQGLFDAMEASLLKLKDTHNRLVSDFDTADTYNFWEDFEVHFSIKVVNENYMEGNLQAYDAIYYEIVDNIGYIYIRQMRHNNALQKTIRKMHKEGVEGLIIDIRHNGGGDSNGIPDLLGDFVKKRTLLGSYQEKSGPGHQDKTNPIPIYAYPSADFHFNKPTVLMINRRSYSASSYMAAMFKGIDNVQLLGQITGGGGGGNYGHQLSNSWLLAVSVSDFLDKEGNSIEIGVAPDIQIENSEADIEAGRDIMLERAFAILKN
ncbi:MAG: S41 family peptidase [Bacteroidota bacterium]